MNTKLHTRKVNKADAIALCDWWNHNFLRAQDGRLFTARHFYVKSRDNPRFFDVMRDLESTRYW